MILIDYQDARPIYEQIVEKFEKLIVRGILEPDSQMPSVRSLAMELSINPNTIQKAYAELERRGYLYSVKGRGNYVAFNDRLKNKKKEELLAKFLALKNEAQELGISKEEIAAFFEEEENHD